MIESLLLRAARAEARVLRDQVDAVRETVDGLRRLLVDSAVLIAHCRDYPVKVRRYWDDFNKASEGRALTTIDLEPIFTVFLSLIDTCQETIAAVRQALEVAELYREDWQEESLSLIPPLDLAPLGAAVEGLAALRAEISREWEWLNEPPGPPKRPLPTRAEAEAALAAGEYIPIEDIIAEIKGTPPKAP